MYTLHLPSGVVTSSELTTESDTTAEPDLVSFCASLGNNRALRVPALFKQGEELFGWFIN